MKTEVAGAIEYEWSTDKILYKLGAGTTPSSVLADKNANGQPIVSKRFNEVNLVHQMGEFCYAITENEKFILGFAGTSAPVAHTTAAVAAWIGTLPETNIDGTIIANGTGLLGNRFMVGSTSQRADSSKQILDSQMAMHSMTQAEQLSILVNSSLLFLLLSQLQRLHHLVQHLVLLMPLVFMLVLHQQLKLETQQLMLLFLEFLYHLSSRRQSLMNFLVQDT
jgi:hypothetical protein